MSFYNTANPSRFAVGDPFVALSKEVALQKAEIASIDKEMTPQAGMTLWFDYPSPARYHTTQKAAEGFPDLNENAFVIQKVPTADNPSAVKTDTLLPGSTRSLRFCTSPDLIQFGSWFNEGGSLLHFAAFASANGVSARARQFIVWETNGAIDVIGLGQWTEPQSILKGEETAEYVFRVDNVLGNFNYAPGTLQLFVEIELTNTSTFKTVTVSSLYNAPFATRFLTNLQAQPALPMYSWAANGYDRNYYEQVPQGSMTVCGWYGGSPASDPIPMSYLVNGDWYVRFSSEDLLNNNLYDFFSNSFDYNTSPYVGIKDLYNPTNFVNSQVSYFDWDIEPELAAYRGFSYMYQITWDSDPSINRILIYSVDGGSTQIGYTSYDKNSQDDDFFVGFDSNPSTLIFTVLYGATRARLTDDELGTYFCAFIDNVVYNSDNTLATVTEMQSNFNANFESLKASVPPLFSNFALLTYVDLPIVDVSTSGVGFIPNVSFGRNYFRPSDYNGPIESEGSGYAVGDQVKVLGTDLGGDSPANDCFITITQVGQGGEVLDFTCSGTGKYLQNQYYIRDGGDDQYDEGNSLNNQYNSDISYGDGSVQPDLFGSGSETIVDYNESIFVMFNTNTSDNNQFYLSGNLGSDGEGQSMLWNGANTWWLYFDTNDYMSYNGYFIPGQVYTMSITYNPDAVAVGAKRLPAKERFAKRAAQNTKMNAPLSVDEQKKLDKRQARQKASFEKAKSQKKQEIFGEKFRIQPKKH